MMMLFYKLRIRRNGNGLKKASFSEAWESLKEDIRTLPCFDSFHKNMTKNQQFYKIVFDEVIRKYFGAEMVNQYRFLVNRTPFLDIDFLKALSLIHI